MSIRLGHSPAGPRDRWMRRQSGFTLVDTSISFLLAAVVLTGAWSAFYDMRLEWKLGNAERIMDQYGQAAMKELTNTLSWAWGAEQIQGGSRNSRWKFKIDDVVEENGSMDRWRFRRENDMIEITYRPTRGILINNSAPQWAENRRGSQYTWFGSRATTFKLKNFDHRDRMTVEGVLWEFDRFSRYPTFDPVERLRRQMVVQVEITMHYRYTANNWLKNGIRMHGDTYVRERKFTTKIELKNWDVEGNPYRDQILGIS